VTSAGDGENWLVSCYADESNGGSIYFYFSQVPTAPTYEISVYWQVATFGTTAVTSPNHTPLVGLKPAGIQDDTRIYFRGTDYFCWGITTGAVTSLPADGTFTLNARQKGNTPSQTLTSTWDTDTLINFPYYFWIFGGDENAQTASPVPVGSLLSLGVSELVPDGATKNYPAPLGAAIQLYQTPTLTPPPLYDITGTQVYQNSDNSILISNYVYGAGTPLASLLAADGIGGVRFTFLPPSPPSPQPPLVFYDFNFNAWQEFSSDSQTGGSITLPAQNALTDGTWRVLIQAGSSPSLASCPIAATYSQDTWIQQAQWSAGQIVAFDYARKQPAGAAQTPGTPVCSVTATSITGAFSIASILLNPINPPVSIAAENIFLQYSLYATTPVVVSQVAATSLVSGVAIATITGLANQTQYLVRTMATNGLPTGNEAQQVSPWVLVQTNPAAPLLEPPVIEGGYPTWSQDTNLVEFRVNTAACGGTGTLFPYVYYSTTNTAPALPTTYIDLTLLSGTTWGGFAPVSPAGVPFTMYYSLAVEDENGASLTRAQSSLVVATAPVVPLPNISRFNQPNGGPNVGYRIQAFVTPPTQTGSPVVTYLANCYTDAAHTLLWCPAQFLQSVDNSFVFSASVVPQVAQRGLFYVLTTTANPVNSVIGTPYVVVLNGGDPDVPASFTAITIQPVTTTAACSFPIAGLTYGSNTTFTLRLALAENPSVVIQTIPATLDNETGLVIQGTFTGLTGNTQYVVKAAVSIVVPLAGTPNKNYTGTISYPFTTLN